MVCIGSERSGNSGFRSQRKLSFRSQSRQLTAVGLKLDVDLLTGAAIKRVGEVEKRSTRCYTTVLCLI